MRRKWQEPVITAQPTRSGVGQDFMSGTRMPETSGGQYDTSAPDPMYGSRRQGVYDIPNNQKSLNQAALGQVCFCPNCGECWSMPMDQRLECKKCKGLFTLSWGRDHKGDVVIVRIDRWR